MSVAIVESALSLLFPPLCLGCGTRIPNDEADRFLCANCERKIVRLATRVCARCGHPTEEAGVSSCARCPTFQSRDLATRSATVYATPVREMVFEFKFHGNRKIRPRLYDLFLEGAERHLDKGDFDAIVPVPLHWWRRFQREFNQAELLGQALSDRWGIPLVTNGVKRVRLTPPQSRLPGRWRERNIQGAFRAGMRNLAGARVLLVDDVMTTGQTLAACSEAVLEGGAMSVVGYTLARRV